MASLFLLFSLATVAMGMSTTDPSVMNGSDIGPDSSGSGYVTGCSTTKISAKKAEGDYAWVLKGAGAIARQINGPEGFLMSNFTFSKTVGQLGNLPGSWSLRLTASEKHHKILVCLNNVDQSEKVEIIHAGAGIVSGNSSMLLQPVRPHCHRRRPDPIDFPHLLGNPPPPPPHHNGPHDHPHPPPPHHETRDHPHPPPPHHEHPHPHPPHHPGDKMLFPHPHEDPEDFEDFSDLGCQRIWKLCPRQLSERILNSVDSNDDVALVFGIKTATFTIEDQSGMDADCNIPSFAQIEKLLRPQIDQPMGEPDGTVVTAVMETGTTGVPDMK